MAWEDVDDLLAGEADADLRATGEVGPALAAYAGSEALLLVYLRPFAKGAHLDALIEVAALAVPLGANRLALSMGARAWSLDDPIPPVVPGVGDLRQRAVTVHRVDAAGSGEPCHRSTLWPITVEEEAVVWGDPIVEDAAVGPLPEALAALLSGTVEATSEDLRQQAQRCVRLGHDLYLTAAGEARLGGITQS